MNFTSKAFALSDTKVHMHGRLYIRFEINYMQIHPDIHNQIKFINCSAIIITSFEHDVTCVIY